MSPTIRDLGIDRLSAEERIRLIGEIWDSLSPPEQSPLISRSWIVELKRQMRIRTRGKHGKRPGIGCGAGSESPVICQ